MAYPEPIPVVKAKDAIKFEKNLTNFNLTSAQKLFYKNARKTFKPRE